MNLESGVPEDGYLNACPAGIGTLGLEFGILSRLTGDPVFDSASRRAVDTLWSFRNPKTGLLGMGYACVCTCGCAADPGPALSLFPVVIDMHTGVCKWRYYPGHGQGFPHWPKALLKYSWSMGHVHVNKYYEPRSTCTRITFFESHVYDYSGCTPVL